jgi:type IV secretory pathway TrbD component
MTTPGKSRTASITTSTLLFVIIAVALVFVYAAFGWPLWQGVVVAVALGLFAAGANYLIARHTR